MDDRIQKLYHDSFEKGLTEQERAVKVLNAFRNFYYIEGNTSEQGIIANAINTILPDYTKKILPEYLNKK
jgi:hypothetical protein